jgi:hypothetical protein
LIVGLEGMENFIKILDDVFEESNAFFADLSTNLHFTLKGQQMKYEDLKDFIKCYNPSNRFKRKETKRFKKFKYDEIISRDKTNLDIFWLKDESLGDLDNLPDPDIIAADIVEPRIGTHHFPNNYRIPEQQGGILTKPSLSQPDNFERMPNASLCESQVW